MHLLRNAGKLKDYNNRTFFGALNIIFNRVNKKRIKEVGPDRACAEWLMRNGAFVRWKGHRSHVSHYNFLPLDKEDSGQYYIEEVMAQEASITHHGFEHFYGCHYITTMKFDKCWYFDDNCINKLDIVMDSLLSLEITRCGDITDKGLLNVSRLKNLQILKLYELEGVKDIQACIADITKSLPKCQINTAVVQD